MSDTQTLIENRPPSVAALFLERVAATPDAEAYRYPVPSASGQGPDEWRSLSWAQASERVYAIAAGLIELGVQPEQRVALASSTRVEWILADLGIMCAGGATTTIYPQTNADESAFILSDSESRVLIAEDAAQVAKAVEKRAELPELAKVVVVDPAGVESDDWVITLDELERRGAAYLEKHPQLIKERVGAITREQLATLIYTSGTTGRPKGVRLPHDNWAYMAKAIASTGLVTLDDVQYLWLPLAHVFGKVLTSGQIEVGHVTAVDGRVDKIIENLPVVQPTYMAAVPRIFEKVYNGVAAKAGGRRRQVQDLPVGRRGLARVRQGHPGQLPPHRHRLGTLRARRQAQGRRHPRLRQAPRGLRRPAARLRLRRLRARPGDRLLLRRRRHPHPGGLRPHRVLRGLLRQPRRGIPHRHRRQAAARHRGPHRRRRRDPAARPRHHGGLPRAAREDRRGAGVRRLVPHR